MGIGKFLGNVVKSVGHTVDDVGDALKSAEKSIKKVPVLGTIYSISPIGVASSSTQSVITLANDISAGKRIDKAALGFLKREVNTAKEVAPYAASVASMVPGVGSGVAAALMAASTLAEGRPWDEALVAGVKGAIPGGPIAQGAFSAAVAAAQGKKIDDIAIAALPIPDKTKALIKSGLIVTQQIAKGKRVDKAFMASFDNALKALPPDIAKGMQVGMAGGLAKALQVEKIAEFSKNLPTIAKIGAEIAKRDSLTATARAIGKNADYFKGFDVGTGLMQGKNVGVFDVNTIRNTLQGEVRKGYDAALALHTGRVIAKPVRTLGKKAIPPPRPVRQLGKRPIQPVKAIATLPTEKAAVAYYTFEGMQGHSVAAKTEIARTITSDPQGKMGAIVAVKAIAKERQSLWQRILSWLGIA